MKKQLLLVFFFLCQLGFSQQVTHVQYWFGDNFSSRILQSVTSNTNNEIQADIPFPDDITHLSGAILHYRFLDSLGNWSVIHSTQMDTTPINGNQLTQVEYWFDEDFANRILQPITTSGNDDILLDIPYPDNGTNRADAVIHYRFQDGAGNWSAVISRQMNTLLSPGNQNVSVEYWFDTAFESRMLSPLNTASGSLQNIDITWPSEAKTINYRFKGSYNQWSAIQSSALDMMENRDNKIVAVEYWQNDGFDLRETLDISQNDTIYLDQRDLDVDLSACEKGTLHLRYKDQMGRWSCIYPVNIDYVGNNPGVTVLVHGFQAFGEQTQSLSDFEKMGAAILNRAKGGAMFKNNPATGQWELVVNIGDNYYPLDFNKEIVLVYDWRDLSNNNTLNLDFGGNGYLEAAADNLFASFINPPEILAVTKEQMLNKPKHFIAHSRGNILTLQFLHRMATYFPDVTIDQFTLLDPHPATTFGDMNASLPLSPPNLPCVYGSATTCGFSTGCYNAGDSYLKIPYNVIRADNYFRRDSQFEGITDLGSFDGLPVYGLDNYNRELNNTVLSFGAPIFGAEHSAVHLWYRGTIDTTENVANLTLIPPLSSEAVTAYWYANGSNNMANDFLQQECRQSSGFKHSRIGGGQLIPELAENKKESKLAMDMKMRDRYGLSAFEYPLGVSPHSVNGGYFDNSNDAGWNKNGGFSTAAITNGKAQLTPTTSLKHSLMYFGPQFRYLKMVVSDVNPASGNPAIGVTFFDHTDAALSYFPTQQGLDSTQTEFYFLIPEALRGEVGSFRIETNTELQVDNIQLVETTRSLSITLKLYLEGYYDPGIHQMRPVQVNQGIGTDTAIADQITVELMHPDTLVNVVAIDTALQTDGAAVCRFPSLQEGAYYIVIKHRNALQTWSALPVYIGLEGNTYDFSTATSKAYGDTMATLETGVYGLFSGDINQDGFIDAADYSLWETEANQFFYGVSATDLNGDGLADPTDYSIWESNNNAFIYSSHP